MYENKIIFRKELLRSENIQQKKNIVVLFPGDFAGMSHILILKLDMNFDYLFRSSYMPV